MRIRDFVTVAGLTAYFGEQLVLCDGFPDEDSLQRFWSLSRNWQRQSLLQLAALDADLPSEDRLTQSRAATNVLADIFSAQVLMRVFGAVLSANDHLRGERRAGPLAEDVHHRQLELRAQALMLMLHPTGLAEEHVSEAELYCRRTERWTDLLLGPLMPYPSTATFAFDPERAGDFYQDLRIVTKAGRKQELWSVHLSTLSLAFPDRSFSSRNSNALAESLSGMILASVPASLIKSFRDSGRDLFGTWWHRVLSVIPGSAVGLTDLPREHA